MTLEEAKNELEKFVKLKTTMRPAFLDVILKAEPVRHGKWINDKGLYKCSVCNEFATIAGFANCIPIEQMNKVMKYCNNCGAKMYLKEVEE